MNYFHPEPDRTITSAWIDQGFEIDPNEILQAIEWEQSADSIDKNLGFGATAFGVLGIAALLGLSGITAFMLPPVGLATYGAIAGYNSAISRRRRELEEEFLQDYPAILDLVAQKLAAGESDSKAAAAFDAVFRHYRKGNDEAIAATIAAAPSQPPQLPQQQPTQLEQPAPYIASPQDQDAPTQQRPESLALGGSQQAVAPSYGESKILSPLDRLLSSPYLSRAVFGAQRTGKSYLAAIASQQMHLKKGTKVFHINLHSYGEEDARYWIHAQSARGDMGHLPAGEVAKLIDRAMAVVQSFKATTNALLIVDEIVLTGAIANPYAESLVPLMKEIAAICTELASTGKKRKQAIWTLSPDFVAGAVTQECKAIKSLTVTFVAIPKGRSIDWDGQAIGFHAESFGNVQRNWPALKDAPAMDCDRIVWVDGLWLDLGELPPLMDSKKLEDVFGAKFFQNHPLVDPPTHPEMKGVSREALEKIFLGSPSLEVEPAPIESASSIDGDILALLRSRHPEGLTAGRIRADKKSLKSVDLGEIEFYLEVLLEEGKIRKDGNFFYYK